MLGSLFKMTELWKYRKPLTCIWDAGWYPDTWRSRWPWWPAECRGPHTPPYWWNTTIINLCFYRCCFMSVIHKSSFHRSLFWNQPNATLVLISLRAAGGRVNCVWSAAAADVCLGLISLLDVEPVWSEHHGPAVLNDTHDGVPQEASRVRVHPRRGLVLSTHTATKTNKLDSLST